MDLNVRRILKFQNRAAEKRERHSASRNYAAIVYKEVSVVSALKTLQDDFNHTHTHNLGK